MSCLRMAVLSTLTKRYTGAGCGVPRREAKWPSVRLVSMTVRSVFGDAFETYFRRWWEIVPRAFVIYLGLTLMSLAAGRALGGKAGIGSSFVLTFVGYFWLQALHVLEVAHGERTFRRAARRAPTLIVASIAASLGIVLGLFLLVVPGLLLAVWWSLVVPAVVLEGRGPRAALGRSRELVRGHGFKIFATMAISIAIMAPVAALLTAVIAYVFKGQPETGSFVGELVVDPVIAPFAVLVWSGVYFRPRQAEQAWAPATSAGPATA